MTPIKRLIRYSVTVVASVLLIVLVAIAYHFYTLSPQKLFRENYFAYELNAIRGDTIQANELEQAYRRKDFKTVTELAVKDASLTRKENFLAAMSWLELENYPKAIFNYKKVIVENEQNDTVFMKDETEYYLALTYILNEDFDLALDLMEKIQVNPAHLYHEKVNRKLIRKVRMLKWR